MGSELIVEPSAPEIVVFDRQVLAERTYWVERLSAGGEIGRLRAFRPSLARVEPQELELAIDGEVFAAMTRLARESSFLLYTLLMAGLKAVLLRYTGVARIAVGSPPRRPAAAGPVPRNALAIVDEIDDRLRFRDLLQQVRQTLLDAYSRQRYPYSRLLADLGRQEARGGSPLFQVALRLEEIHGELADCGCPLVLAAERRADRLRVVARFAPDQLEPAAVRRLADHWMNLMGRALAAPEIPIGEIDFLGAAERHEILAVWNDTRAPFPREVCVHELFARQVARRPRALAVADDAGEATYEDLDRRAALLAARLIRRGVGPEVRVGLLAEPSVDMIVGLLAVVKAGGAYVPLDPAYPPERLAFMLADSAAAVLLVQERLAMSLPAGGPPRLLLDGGEEPPAGSGPTAAARATASSLAYVIYTSGSSGQPKGVAVGHRSLTNLVAWHVGAYGIGADDRAAQVAGPAFDAAVWEIWPYLTAGASLHVVDPETRSSPGALVAWLAAKAITVAFCPTPLAEAALPLGWPAGLSLRFLLTGGDRLHEAPDDRLPFVLVNHYGPTENTVVATRGTVRAAPGRAPSIGRPIANVRVHVLDPRLQPLPVGVPGELCIGGDGLARGYLGRPALTAERFVPDPFGGEPGARLYRSGDLVCYLPGGELDFLGRIDSQVKVRGYRIELGEIEAALRLHPAVREAVVAVAEHRQGERRLVAYLVPRTGGELPAAELRASLRQTLPEHMVPAAYVRLDALPLTANGKIDRGALRPPPIDGELADGEGFRAPSTAVEEVLAGIFAAVLRRERVGVDDNFFELGGHSLLATQVMSRVRDVFRVELPLRRLFEGPTVAALAGTIDQLSRPADGREVPPIAPQGRDAAVPLSFAQERLWFLDQLEPQGATYNMPLALRIEGPLDSDAMERSLTEIVRRHEVLRTRFTLRGERPAQEIAAPARQRIALADLAVLAAEERPPLSIALARQEALRPFDLARGPLLRMTLLRWGAEDHVLLFTMHHIISDGWSMGVLVRELEALYDAFRRGEPSPLPPLPVQYADFAIWQRRYLDGAVLEGQLQYWKTALAGVGGLQELPADRPRPKLPSGRGERCEIRLPRGVADRLQTLARSESATIFMTLIAGWAALFSRWTGEVDFAVGTPIANRNRAEVEGLIGFFINTLALRCELGDDPPFQQLAGRLREVALEAYNYQDLPFERLVQDLDLPRDLGRQPLFQVMLVLQNATIDDPHLAGLRLSPFDTTLQTAKFDLELSLTEVGEEIVGALQYAADVFDRTTVTHLARRFETLLAAAVDEPRRRLSGISWLTAAERQAMTLEWNDTAAGSPAAGSVLAVVRGVAERHGGRPAIADERGGWSYGELWERAGRVAAELAAGGRLPWDGAVGVLCDRGRELSASMLGVWWAGGAYMPLDPQQPARRLAQVLEQSDAAAVLVADRHLALLDAALAELPCRPRVVRLDLALAAPAERQPSLAEIDPEQVGYIIFTSGSTGVPKGAMVKQRGLLNHLWAKVRDLAIGPDDAVAQTGSQCFDISMWQSLAAALVGGRVEVFSDETTHDPVRFLAELARRRVTVVEAVPSFLRLLLEEIESGGGSLWPGLRWMVATGEALPPESARRWLRRHPGLQNVYGPSECADNITHWRVDPADGEALHVPLGRPIPNLRLYVRGRRWEELGIGVAGELWVGGAGVGRGYLRDGAQTAQAFVPDPHAEEPGGRLYRTGDLGRRLWDGRVEYLGRIDYQVKVRGFRVELGEIESHLGREPGLRAGAVAVRGGQLVAYVVPGEGWAGAARLRESLRGRLPEYMVPGLWVELEALPLNRNGKVDRKRLPEPELDARQEVSAPQSEVESLLMQIWSEVLGIERLGIHDDFFTLGGHSLLAVQVVSRARQALRTELSVRDLFEAPTVALLAARAVGALRSGGALPPPILAAAGGPEAPLSFAQQRLWFLDRLAPGRSTYNMPVALRVAGPLAAEPLVAAFAEVVRRHAVLRTVFPSREGSAVQRVMPATALAPLRLDLAGLPPERRAATVRELAEREAGEPFDLERGPLLRLALVRLAPEEHVLLLTLHHIVSDGWSMEILVREVCLLYAAFAAGRPSPLPELPVQYADFAVWQRAWLQGEALEREVAHWRERLAGGEPLDLPTDRPRAPLQASPAATEAAVWPAGAAAALAAAGRRADATLFMTLLAVFQALLERYTGRASVSVGTPVAGRTRPEIEGLIGCFVNTLVLRAPLGDDPAFGELQRRVRDLTLDAFVHQDVPFDRLVEELQPARDLGRSPLFEVMLALQNLRAEEPSLPGLGLARLEAPLPAAKFELSVTFAETRDGLASVWEYDRGLFDAATIRRMIGHFGRLLAVAAGTEPAALAAPLSTLPMLAPEERDEVLALGAGAREAAPFLAVHERVAAQARRTPAAPALVGAAGEMSYAELARRVGRLAARLRELGSGPEVRVAVCLPRSPEAIVALLAVLESGGAYVPFEPATPAERLPLLLADCGARLLVESPASPVSLPEGSAVRRVRVDEAAAGAPEQAAAAPVEPLQAAYVIYTSGSTGQPKGVVVSHGGLANYAAAAAGALAIGPGDRVLQLASLAFDTSAEEIYPCLTRGAALVPLPAGMLDSPARFLDGLARLGITVVDLPTAYWHELVAAMEEDAALRPPPSLRLAIVGGEAALATRTRRWREIVGARVELVNTYGPTEGTIVATSCALGSAPAGEVLTPYGVPIGRSVANVDTYVVGPHLELLPAGVDGELLLGGSGVARGYLGRAERTAERFVPHPFAGAGGAGERLYRTGDRVRRTVGGDLLYRGRLDGQMKVRGFRVEPGEIEAALTALPGVQEAAVVLRSGRLVAYLVPAAGEDVAIAGLEALLRRRLPEFMIPGRFVTLPALPRTVGGKVDRRALPAPHAAAATATLGPRDGLESALAAIWGEVLELDRAVGVDEDFFRLGGHSLLAVRLVARVERTLGQRIALADLFEGRTIESLAALLRRRRAAPAATSTLVAIRAGGSAPPLFVIHPVGGDVLCYGALAHHLGEEQPVFGLRARGVEDAGPLPASVEAMARDYLHEIRAVQPQGPYRLAGWSMGGVVAFEMARQLESQGDRVAQVVLLDAELPGAWDPWRPTSRAELVEDFARDLGLPPPRGARRGRRPKGVDPLARLRERAVGEGVLPAELPAAELERRFALFVHHDSLLRRYRPGPYAGSPVLLLAPGSPDREHAWRRWIADLAVEPLAAGHYELLREPAVRDVAERLRRRLAAGG